ncbi:Gad1 [Trypoxylus dichotomus]
MNTSNYKLGANIAHLRCTDLLPYKEEANTTNEFLRKIFDVLADFVKATNDRHEKILDFHHPHDMLKLLDLKIPEKGHTLQQLVNDCATTLKYQVKTDILTTSGNRDEFCVTLVGRLDSSTEPPALSRNMAVQNQKEPTLALQTAQPHALRREARRDKA